MEISGKMLTLLLSAMVLAGGGQAAPPADVQLDDDAKADYLAVSVWGNSSAASGCRQGDCRNGIAASGTGSAFAGIAAASLTGPAHGYANCPTPTFCTGGFAASGTGNATGINGAVSGTGDATGGAAFSALGTCHFWYESPMPCYAANPWGPAHGHWLALSPGQANATWLAVGGEHAAGHFAAFSPTGDTQAAFLSISISGNAHGGTAISVLGEASGGCDDSELCMTFSGADLLP